MPQVDPSKFKSIHSASPNTTPDYNFSDVGIDTLGSKDTILNRLTGSYYDKSLNPYRNQNDQRYENQNWIAYVGNNAAALGAKTFAVGIPSLVGSLTSLAASPFVVLGGGSMSDAFEKNPINQVAEYIDHAVDKLTPRFQGSDFNDLNFVQQLARPGELISQNIDSLAFLAQSFVGAGLVNQLGIGTKLAARLAKARPIYGSLTEVSQANNVAKAATIDFYTSLGLLTTNEAALEAKDSKETIISSLKEKRNAGLISLSDQEIEDRAKTGFNNTFWLNMITGSVTNGVFMKLLSPMLKAPLATRANQFSLQLATDNTIQKKALSGIEGFFFDKGNTAGRVTTSILEQVLAEGTEETIQYSIQKAAYIDEKHRGFLDSGAKVLEDITTLEIYNLMDKERGKAFGLGALIGGIASGAANLIPSKEGVMGAVGQAREYRSKQSKAIETYNKRYTDLVDNGIAAKNPVVTTKLSVEGPPESPKFFKEGATKDEISQLDFKALTDKHNLPETGGDYTEGGDYKYDPDGNLMIDPIALSKLGIDASMQSELSDLIKQEQSKENPDKLKLTLYRNSLLAKLAVTAFESGTTDILFEQLGRLTSTPEAFAGGEEVTKEIEYMNSFVKRLEAAYQTGENYFVPSSNSAEAVKDNQARRTAYYSKVNQLLTADDLIQRKSEEVNDIRTTIKDALDTPLAPYQRERRISALFNELSAPNLSDEVIADIKADLNRELSFKDLDDQVKNNKFRPYANAQLDLDFLIDSRAKLADEVTSILERKEWKARDPKAVDRSLIPSRMILTPDTSKEVYKAYRELLTRNLGQIARRKNALASVTSDLINELISKGGLDILSTVVQLTQFLERVLSNSLKLTADTVNLLKTYIYQVEITLNETAAYINEEFKKFKTSNLDITVDNYETTIDYEDYGDAELKQLGDLLKQVEYYKQLKAESSKLLEGNLRWDALKAELPAVDDFSVIDHLTVGAQKLVDTFNSNENLDNFNDLTSIDFEINNITQLDRLDDKFDGKSMLADLNAFREIVYENLTNKELRDVKDTDQIAMALQRVLPLTDVQTTALATLDPITAIAVLLDLPNEQDDLLTKHIDVVYAMYSKMNGKYPNITKNVLTRADFESLGTNPVKFFPYILNEFLNSYKRTTRTNPQAVDDFAKTLSVSTLLEAPDSFKEFTNKEIAEMYANVAAASLYVAHKNSPLTARLGLTRALELLQQSKADKLAGKTPPFPPTISQQRLVQELVSLTSTNSFKDPDIFQNVIGIRSPAGAGKSTVIVPTALAILGLKPKNILAAGNKVLAAETIKEATGSPYPVHTAENLLETLQKGVPDDVTLFILDEAAAVNTKLLYNILGAFADLQTKNQDKNYKLWLVYDPNQSGNTTYGSSTLDQDAFTPIRDPIYVAALDKVKKGIGTPADIKIILTYQKGLLPGPTGVLPLIHNLTSVSPISVSYRSNVAEIGASMNQFLSSSEVTLVKSATSKSIDDLKDIEGVFTSKLSPNSAVSSISEKVRLSQKLNPGRTRVIITTNENKVSYAASFPDVTIATPQEVAGKSFDEVYIDLPKQANAFKYNQDMYTAYSRARLFIYSTSTAGINDVDVNIPIKTLLASKVFALEFDTHITTKKEQIADYDRFYHSGTARAADTTKVPKDNTPPADANTKVPKDNTPPADNTPPEITAVEEEAKKDQGIDQELNNLKSILEGMVEKEDQAIDEELVNLRSLLEEEAKKDQQIDQELVNLRAILEGKPSEDKALEDIDVKTKLVETGDSIKKTLIEIDELSAELEEVVPEQLESLLKKIEYAFEELDSHPADNNVETTLGQDAAALKLLQQTEVIVLDLVKQLRTLRDLSKNKVRDTTSVDIRVKEVLDDVVAIRIATEQADDEDSDLEDEFVEQVDSLEEYEDIVDDITINDKDLLLKHPNNFVFRTAILNVGDEVRIYKDVSAKGTRYIVTKLYGDKHIEVAVLSDEEVKSLPDFLQKITTLPSAALQKITDGDVHYYIIPPALEFATTYIGPSQRLQHIYDPNYTWDYTENGYGELVEIYINQLSELDNNYIVNKDEVLSNLSGVDSNQRPYVSLVLYSEAEIKKMNDPLIRPSVPYLRIQGLRTVSGEIKPLHIIHRPSIIQQGSYAAEKIGLQNIYEFIELTEAFEKMTFQHQELKNTIYAGMTMDTTIDMKLVDPQDQRNKYYPYAAFIAALSDAHLRYLNGEANPVIQVASKELNTMLRAKYPAAVLHDLKYLDVQRLAESANEIDSLLHGESLNEENIPVRKANGGRIRKYKGKAQKAFNRIAATNYLTTLPTGQLVILRDYPGYSQEGDKAVGVGMPLGGRPNFETELGSSLNPPLTQAAKSQLKAKYARLEANNKQESSMGLQLKSIIDAVESKYDAHLKPLSLAILKSLFIDSQDKDNKLSGVGNGFGLRMPLSFLAFKNVDKVTDEPKSPIADQVLMGFVETQFKRVIPTRISLTANPVAGETTVDVPTAVKTPMINFYNEINSLKEINADLVKSIASKYGVEVDIPKIVSARQQDLYYATRSILIAALVRKNLKLPTLKEQLYNAIEMSNDAISYTKVKGVTEPAPRDYLRAVVLSMLFDSLTADELVKQAQKYWISKATKTDAKLVLDEVLILSFENMFTPEGELRLVGLEGTIMGIAEENNLTLKKAKTKLERVEAIVEVLRKLSKQEVIKSTEEKNLAKQLMVFKNEGENINQMDTEWYNKRAVKELVDRIADQELSGYYTATLEDEDSLPFFIHRLEELLFNPISRDLKRSSATELGDNLTPAEAKALYNRIVSPTLLDRLKSAFKRKSKPYFRIISTLEMQHSLGKNNWGLFKNGIVYVIEDKDGVKSKVVKHEAFHKVFWNYLTAIERLTLLDLARAKHGDKTTIELEEDLANGFMNYVAKPKSFSGKLYEMFRKILNFFGFVYNNIESIDAFFDELSSGMVSGKENNSFSLERNLAEKWPTVELYTRAKTLFLETFDNVYNGSQEILSFDEALEDTFDLLNNMFITRRIEFGRDEFELYKTAIAPILDRKSNTSKDFIAKYFKTVNNKDSKAVKISALEDQLQELVESRTNEVDTDLDSAIESVNASIAEETFESDLFNPLDKITGRIKQRLVLTKYTSKGAVVQGDFFGIFNALLPILSDIPNSSLPEIFTILKKRTMEKIGSPFPGIIPNNVRKAAAEFILNTIDSSELNIKNSSDAVTFYRDVNFPTMYAVYSSTESTRGITYSLARDNPLFQIFVKPENQRISEWVKTFPNYKKSYDYSFKSFEDLTFIKSIVSAIGSLTRGNPFVAVQQYKNFKYRTTYSPNNVAGKEAILENKIISSLLDRLITKVPIFTANNRVSFTAGEKDATPNRSVKAAIIKLALTNIKLPASFISDLGPSAVDNLFRQLSFLMPRLQNIQISYNENANYETLFNSINDEGSTISLIVDLMASSSSAVEVNNFIRADGRKAYLYKDSSYQTSLITYLLNKEGFFPHLIPKKKGFTTTSKLLETNKFLWQPIFSHIQHDGIKSAGTVSYAVGLTAEKPRHFFERTFKYGFLSRLKSSGKKSYYQFLPIPSSRTTISGLEVAVSYDLREEITTIIKAQMDRPPATEYPLNKNYAKNRNKFTFPGLSGDVSGLHVKDVVDKVYAHIKAMSLAAFEEAERMGIKYDATTIDTAVKLFEIVEKDYLSDSKFTAKLKELRRRKDPNNMDSESEVRDAKDIQEKALKAVVRKLYYHFYENHIVNQYSLSQLIYGDEVFFKSKEDETKRIQSATGSGDIALADSQFGLSRDNPLHSQVLVIEDVVGTLPDYLNDYRPASFQDEFEESDAQGLATPAMYEAFSNALGAEASADVVLKPLIYYQSEKGEPKLIKFSITVISDEFLEGLRNLKDGEERIKLFSNLRSDLEQTNVGLAVFSSAFKLGSTSKPAVVSNDLINGGNGLLPENIVSIDPSFFRFQLNPAKEVDVDVSNPSQVTAMLNTNGKNETETTILHKLNAIQIRTGLLEYNIKAGLQDNLPTQNTKKKVRNLIVQKAESSPSTTHVNSLLRFKSPTGQRVSLNAPLVHQKIVSLLTSLASSMTVGFRIPGSKLVLQTEVGTYSAKTSRLQFKDKDGYTEVLLPESYRSLFSEGDVVGVKNSIVGFRIPTSNLHSAQSLIVKGFYKVPEGSLGNIVIAPAAMVYITGNDFDVDTLFLIRKAVLKEDVNLYPYGIKHIAKKGTSLGVDDNIITIGNYTLSEVINNRVKELLAEINVLTFQSKGKNALLVGEKSAIISLLLEYSKEATNNAIVHTISKTLLDRKNRYDLNTPITLDRVKKTKGDTKNALISKFKSLIPYLKAAGVAEEFLTSASFIKEVEENGFGIVSEITENGRRIRARYDYVSSPLSIMETLASLANPNKEGYWTLAEVEKELYPKGNLTDYLVQSKIHQNTYSGIKLTEITAATTKVLGYMYSGTPITKIKLNKITYDKGTLETVQLLALYGVSSLEALVDFDFNVEVLERELPTLNENTRVKIDKHVYSTLSREELTKSGPVYEGYRKVNTFETLDTALNLAIDNTKEQKLPFLAITNENASLYLAAIAIGIPFTDVMLMFRELEGLSFQEENIDLEMSRLDQLVTGDYLDVIGELDYSGSITSEIMDKAGTSKDKTITSKLVSLLLIKGSVSTQVLRNGSEKARVLNKLILLKEIKKLSSIGNALFRNSRPINLLKGISNEGWKLRSALEKYEESLVDETFTNVKLDKIPNIKAAVETSKAVYASLEEIIDIYKPKIVNLAKAVGQKVSISFSKDENENAHLISMEVLKMLSADLILNLGSDVIDLNVDTNLSFTLPNGEIVYGSDAFGQQFVLKVIKAAALNPSNVFLNSLEVRTMSDSTKTLALTANKTNEEEIDLILIRDFASLYNSPETKELALGFLKYEVVNRGLLYGRTSISGVFPPAFIAGLTQKLDERLASLNALGSTTSIVNRFIPQFIRNNNAKLKFVSKDKDGVYPKPKQTSYYLNSQGTVVKTYADNKNGFHYDLAYPNVSSTYPTIIKTYGENTYKRIGSDTDFVYYRLFTTGKKSKYYDFRSEDLFSIYDASQAMQPELAVIQDYKYTNRSETEFVQETGVALYDVNDIVYLLDNKNGAPLHMTKSKISSVRTIKSKIFYTIEKEEVINFNTPTAASAPIQIKSAFDVASLIEYVSENNLLGLHSSNVQHKNLIRLDLTTTSSALAQIEALQKIVVSEDIFTELYQTAPESAIIIAQALYDKTGYRDYILDAESPLDVVKYRKDVRGELSSYQLDKKGPYVKGNFSMGDILQLGKNSKGAYVFGKITAIILDKNYIKVFGTNIFNKLTDDNFDDLYNQTC